MAAERVTAPKVMDALHDHLAFHQNKVDPKLHNHHVILFGEKGDGGMCADVREIKQGYATMKGIGVAILVTLLGNMILLVIK